MIEASKTAWHQRARRKSGKYHKSCAGFGHDIQRSLLQTKKSKKKLLACRPWREHSNTLKNVLGSQWAPKNRKDGPHSWTYSLSHSCSMRACSCVGRQGPGRWRYMVSTAGSAMLCDYHPVCAHSHGSPCQRNGNHDILLSINSSVLSSTM
jgi:hypothetical protein